MPVGVGTATSDFFRYLVGVLFEVLGELVAELDEAGLVGLLILRSLLGIEQLCRDTGDALGYFEVEHGEIDQFGVFQFSVVDGVDDCPRVLHRDALRQRGLPGRLRSCR